MSVGRDEVEATVNPCVHDVLPVEARLTVEVGGKLVVNVPSKQQIDYSLHIFTHNVALHIEMFFCPVFVKITEHSLLTLSKLSSYRCPLSRLQNRAYQLLLNEV